ncbi:MAG TPA: ABC transporter permease [Microbacterium sp.]|nr:ABC transporter permease [Microbacterium sp.]
MTTVPFDRSDFDVPGRGLGMLDVFRNPYLLKVLVQKSTSLRYRNSVLGWLWSYVRPTVQFFVYFFVIGHVMGQSHRVDAFPLYLFSGIVVVNLFNESFGNATKSIVINKALVRKIYLPRELFPISAVISSFINVLPQLAVLLVVALFFGWLPTWSSVLLILAAMLLILLFSTGIGLMASAVNVRFRDAQNFVEIVRMIATWTAPVLYTWVMIGDLLPGWLFGIWASNPLTVCVELFHQAVWAVAVGADANIGLPPGFGLFLGIAITITVVCLLLGQYIFRRLERTFAQDL